MALRSLYAALGKTLPAPEPIDTPQGARQAALSFAQVCTAQCQKVGLANMSRMYSCASEAISLDSGRVLATILTSVLDIHPLVFRIDDGQVGLPSAALPMLTDPAAAGRAEHPAPDVASAPETSLQDAQPVMLAAPTFVGVGTAGTFVTTRMAVDQLRP